MSHYGLAPLSWMYLGGIRLRHWLYDHKLLSKQFAPLPVVSIGNLVAGGAGKTQVALLLAEALSSTLPVAILSRGYRSSSEHAADPLIVDTKKHSPSRAGDEPWMLSSRLAPSAFVVVNKSRYKSALTAEKWGARILILDDGMQHRALHRDFEIVVVDGQTQLGPFLPRGRLREDPSRLKNADLVLFMGEPEKGILQSVSARTDAPQVVAKIVSQGIFDLHDKDAGTLHGKKVGLFCGIGIPNRFVKTVEDLGAEIVLTHFSPDHQIPSSAALQTFAASAYKKGADFLVCTEKDKVKLSLENTPVPIVWVKVGLQLVHNREAWDRSVEQMKLIASHTS